MINSPTGGQQNSSRQSISLGLFVGLMYFIQGVGEPTEGLVAQPVRSLLKDSGYGAAEIGTFAALLALPWWLKPLYGLLSDFVPLAGYRRRSYLIVASAIAVIGFLAIYGFSIPADAGMFLFLALLLPTTAVAFSDVVLDALVVERGQAAGLTGRLQSVQWTAMWGATILTGFIGGYLSQYSLQNRGFLICGLLSVLGLGLSVLLVKERAVSKKNQAQTFARASVALREAAQTPQVIFACAFLFLWSFNPFSTTVLYLHTTTELGFSEQFYGNTVSLMALGSLLASGAYGLYCRRIAFPVLLHGSVICGVLATIGYLALHDVGSAAVLSLAVGFFHMTGTMVQLDLAARSCPLKSAATVFALLMALSNLSVSLSAWLGGNLYERWGEQFGTDTAFRLLVILGSLITAGCWFLVPLLLNNRRGPKIVIRPVMAEVSEAVA